MTQASEDEETETGPRVKRRGAKVVRHSLRAIWLLATLPFAVLLLLSVLLIDRDVTAPSWVKNRVQERAALILAGGSLEFGEIMINIGLDLHPRVKLTNTVLRDADGATLAEVDEISGLMSPRGLVFERAALMQEVDLKGVDVSLNRAADGSVALAFDRNTSAVDAAPSLAELIAQSEAVFDRPALQAMEQVRISDLALTYNDARAEQVWTMVDGALALDLRNDLRRLTGELPLQTGGDVPTLIALEYEGSREEQAATMALSLDNVVAQDIAEQSPAVRWLAAVDAPLSATLSTGLDNSGQILPLEARLDIGTGELRPNPNADAISFDKASVRLRFDPATNVLRFQDVALQSERGTFSGSGQAIARDLRDGIPAGFLAQFTFEDIALSPPGLYAEPLDIAQADVDLRLTLNPFKIEVGQAVVTDPKLSFVAKGRAEVSNDGWTVALDLQGDQLDTPSLHAIWPETFKPKTRNWLVNNLTEAHYSDLTFAMRLSPDAPAAIAAGFKFEEARIRFMKTMPIIRETEGYASLADHHFGLSLDRGKVNAPQGGELDLAGSTLLIKDIRKAENVMTIGLHTQSTVTAALSILDQAPFQFLSKANLPVTLADGRAELSGDITIPLGRRPEAGETQFDMAGTLTRVSSDAIIPERTLSGSNITVQARNEELRFDGSVNVNGVPMRGNYVLPIGAAFRGESAVDVDVELSPRFLDAFNIALPPGSVEGRGTGRLRIDLARGRAPSFDLSSNLRGVTVALPAIGWSKAPNADGNLLVRGALGAQPTVETLEIGGGGLTAEGRVDFNGDGSLEAARFSTVRLGNWLNAPITLRGRGEARPVGVEISGGTLDLRRAQFGGGGRENGPLSIALDRLQITDGIALDEFRGTFDGAGGFSGQFQGQLNGAATVQGTVAPQNGRSAVRLISDNAGGVVRAAGLMKNAVGGSLDLTLLPAAGEGNFDGVLAVRNLRVTDAPTMAALLDAISVVGLLQQLDGQGLSFDAVDASFRLTPRQVILTQSSAVGPGLGISLDGVYTLANKSVDFQGVVSPFYLVNQIGSVLTRRGEGLIGFNFNIGGTVDSPSVTVNPLSAFTPGMFREIFRRAPPQVTQ